MNITPGTLCLVIGCRIDPQNIGKSVVVDHFLTPGDRTPTGTTVARDVWLVYGGDLGVYQGEMRINPGYGLFAPEHLLPIQPLAEPTEVKQQERMKA